MTDVLDLAKRLMAAPSVTPATGAVFDAMEAMLVPLGFEVTRFTRGEGAVGTPEAPVENLFAIRRGPEGSRHLAFAGHLDVVPPGGGWTSVPRPSPSQTAIWPVTTNKSIARPPTAPSLRKSPIAATPETRLKKISGTTSILIDLMKKSPIHLMLSASGPQAQPVSTPRMSAVITRCHSGISNQVLSNFPTPRLVIASGQSRARIHAAVIVACKAL